MSWIIGASSEHWQSAHIAEEEDKYSFPFFSPPRLRTFSHLHSGFASNKISWFTKQETDKFQGSQPSLSGQGVRGNRASYGCRGGRGRTRSSTVSASEFLLYEITISGGLLLLFLRMHFLKRSYYYCVIYFFISLNFLTTSIDKKQSPRLLAPVRAWLWSKLFIYTRLHSWHSIGSICKNETRASFLQKTLLEPQSHTILRAFYSSLRIFLNFTHTHRST